MDQVAWNKTDDDDDDDFVVNVDSISIFKNRLDTFWSNQDIMFDHTAELTGIGDRSEFASEN